MCNLKIFQYGKYLVAYVLKLPFVIKIFVLSICEKLLSIYASG